MTAVVLGAGGAFALAYHVGVLEGLRDVGIPSERVDRFVGTSAGSVIAGAVLHGTPTSEILRKMAAVSRGDLARELARHLTQRMLYRRSRPRDVVLEGDRSLLSAAARSDVMWNDRLWIAAVRLSDYQTVIFGRDLLGMTLGEAVDASCAVPHLIGPKAVAGDFYLDGAVKSPTNASVVIAETHDLVVISAPMSRPGHLRRRARAQADLRRDVAEIEAAGLRPTVLVPSPAISAAAARYPYRDRDVRQAIVDDARRQLIEALG